MSPTPPPPATLARIAARAVLCLALAAAVMILTAAAVIAGGLGDTARHTLGLGFGGIQPSAGQAGRIALHNARIAAATLAAAIIAPHLTPRARQALLVVLAMVLVCNAGAIGIAVGAYGSRLARAIAVHAPIEFAAFALAGGACMQACKHALTVRELTIVAATAGILLVAAGVLETFAWTGPAR